MKKILKVTGLILALFLIAIFYVAFYLNISGLHLDNDGLHIQDFSLKQAHVKAFRLTPSLNISAKELNLGIIKIRNISLDKNLNMKAEIYDIKVYGKLSLKRDKIEFKGNWQRPYTPLQQINVTIDKNYLYATSSGSLGWANFKKEFSSNKLHWQVKKFKLLKNTQKLSGQGYINQDHGEIKLTDGSNTLATNFSANSFDLNLNATKPQIWFKSGIANLKANIKFKNNQLLTKTSIEGSQKIIIDSNNKNFKINITDNKKSWAILARLHLRKNFKIQDLQHAKLLLDNFNNRFNKIHKLPPKPKEYSKINFRSDIPSNIKLISKDTMPLTGTIQFNLLYPEATEVSAEAQEITGKTEGNAFQIKHINIHSQPKASELKLNGLYNNKKVELELIYNRYLTAKIIADNITLPISNNISLIVSPRINISKYGNFSNINGFVNINGGTIKSKSSSIVHMPENTQILGRNAKEQPIEWILKNLHGKVILNTSKPILLEDLAGLSGKLTGELVMTLNNHLDPKFTGSIKSSNTKYLRNNKINVEYAKATYEHNLIENPLLDIKLTRKINRNAFELLKKSFLGKQEVVGINIRGSAKQPEISPFSNNPKLSKLQIIAALETGATNGIGPEQGMLSLFSMFGKTKNKSPIEAIQEGLKLDEMYFTSSQDYNHDLINPNLGGGAIVLTKTFLDKIKTSYIASLHNKDYLLIANYPLNNIVDFQLYSSRYTNPQILRNNESYGFNLLFYKSIT